MVKNLMAYWKITVGIEIQKSGGHQKLRKSYVSTSCTLNGPWIVNNIKDQSRHIKVCFVLYEVKDDQ